MTPEQSYALIGLGTGLLQNATARSPYERARIATGLGAGVPLALQGIQAARQESAARQQAAQQDLMRQATLYYLLRQAQAANAANPMDTANTARTSPPPTPIGQPQNLQYPSNAMPLAMNPQAVVSALTPPNQNTLAPKGAAAPPAVGDLLAQLRPEQVAAFLAAVGGNPAQSLSYIAPEQYGTVVNVRDPVTGQLVVKQLSRYGTGQDLGAPFLPNMVDLGGEKRFLDYAQVPNNTSFSVSVDPNEQLRANTELESARMRLAAAQAGSAQGKPSDIITVRTTDPDTGLPVTRFVDKRALSQLGDIEKSTVARLKGAPKPLPTPVLQKVQQAASFGPQLATFLQNAKDYEMPVIGGATARAAAMAGDEKAANALAAFNAMRIAGQSQIPGIPSNRDVEQFIASMPALSKSREQNMAAALQSYKAQREQLELAKKNYQMAGYDTTPIDQAIQAYDQATAPLLAEALPKAKDGAYIVHDEYEAQLVPSGATFVVAGTNVKKVKP